VFFFLTCICICKSRSFKG